MAPHKTSYRLAAVLASLCITFMPRGTNGCTGEPTCMLCVNLSYITVMQNLYPRKLPTIRYINYVVNNECYIDVLSITGVYLYYLFTDMFYVTGLVLTRSISGRNACPSEEVTFTCTAQGNVIFWRNEGFGQITVHYLSPPSRGNFRVVVVSYNRTQNCLVSSLSFRATASRNGTTVTCINRDRSFNQSLSLHIMSSEFLRHFTVVDKL